jgi:hypothetical protein
VLVMNLGFELNSVSVRYSVNACGEQEVLDEWNDLNLTHVIEKFIVVLLSVRVQDHVGAEHEDRSCQNRQDLQALETYNPIEDQVNLVNFEVSHEHVQYPREDSFEG